MTRSPRNVTVAPGDNSPQSTLRPHLGRAPARLHRSGHRFRPADTSTSRRSGHGERHLQRHHPAHPRRPLRRVHAVADSSSDLPVAGAVVPTLWASRPARTRRPDACRPRPKRHRDHHDGRDQQDAGRQHDQPCHPRHAIPTRQPSDLIAGRGLTGPPLDLRLDGAALVAGSPTTTAASTQDNPSPTSQPASCSTDERRANHGTSANVRPALKPSHRTDPAPGRPRPRLAASARQP